MTKKILYIGFKNNNQTAKIVYDSYHEYSLAQVEYFIDNIVEYYNETFNVDEEYTISEVKQIILKSAEEYISFDSDMITCDECGEIIDVYAWENSDDYNSDIEFVFADGSDVYNCDNTDYMKAVEEHIDEIISAIAENIKIIKG